MKWEKSGDFAEARSSHTSTMITSSSGDELLYFLFGESVESRTPIQPPNDLQIFNLTQRKWVEPPTQTGQRPNLRFAHSASALGNNSILVFGGRTAVDETSSIADCYLFDTATGVWSEVNAANRPPARNYHSGASDGSNLAWIFGGCGHEGRLNDLWQYDARVGDWSQLPVNADITGRGGPGFCLSDGSLFVIGGFAGKEMGDVFRYDLTAGKWEAIESASASSGPPTDGNIARFTPRSVMAVASHSCQQSTSKCSHNKDILVFGGEVDPSDLGHAGAGQFANDLLCLDAKESLTWHGLDVLNSIEQVGPCARGWMAATAVDQGMVISGGLDVDNKRLRDIWLLNLHE